MLKHRVIPSLLLSEGSLVKTIRFKNPEYVGDPINVIRIFNDKEVDELAIFDIVASKKEREPDYDLIEQFAAECFMPLSYGGGIRNIDQARRIFSLGVEKICLQSSILSNSAFIRELVSQFGSQSIMVSLDIKKNWRGNPKLYQSSSGKLIDVDWLEEMQRLVLAGAGEVVLNAVDKDGTLAGPDLSLIKQASSAIGVPLICLGGVSSLADIKACVDAGASAVAAGAFFVYYGKHRAVLITYPSYDELEYLFNPSSI